MTSGHYVGSSAGGRQRPQRTLLQGARYTCSACLRRALIALQVVLSTLHGAGGKQLSGQRFDVVIIDEASQALEAQCHIPLYFSSAPKLILAGDHLQLPPTVKADAKPPKVAQPIDNRFRIPTSLETTLFDRLLQIHGPNIKRMLTVQYRMHEDIMDFPSAHFYNSELTAAPAVAKRRLTDLPHVSDTEDTALTVLFLDTQGGDFPEAPQSETAVASAAEASSHSNPLEAAVAVAHVRRLLDAGVREDEIAVITPYNGQLSLLNEALRAAHPGIEMGSVDGFQGREKEAVVLSLVRSNEKRETGFLKEGRRINVAITRARRHLCVVGDSDTVKRAQGFAGGWVRWVEKTERDGVEVRYPDVSEVLEG